MIEYLYHIAVFTTKIGDRLTILQTQEILARSAAPIFLGCERTRLYCLLQILLYDFGSFGQIVLYF